LNGVLGVAQLLAATPLTAEQFEYVDTIRSSGESLLSILNDVLDLSKIEAGKVELASSPFSVPQLFDGLRRLYTPSAATKGLDFHVEASANLPGLCGDSLRIRQILTNLLGNALKFTHHGSVSLAASYSHGFLELRVSDTGIGIPREKLGEIFDSFSQANSTTSRRFGGTGLGLTISKKLVEIMFGVIEVKSAVGQGTEFLVRIPLKEAELSSSAEADRPEEIHELQGSVLLVEDHPVNAMIAIRFLNRLGVTVVHAENGNDAVKATRNERFDLILMDIHMPVMDGLDATRQIRTEESAFGYRTPIYAMTAAAMKEDQTRCHEAGMDGFITKPVRFETLFGVLRQHLTENPATVAA
jgi:CheY-like chemotaxis protein/anti-sigma regulatory factor (Ser/Thr protein kinase)